MEQWYTLVRSLKNYEDSETSYKIERLAHKMFHDLGRVRIRDKGKFKNRMGPEFENWVASLARDYDSDLINELIGDDEFWETTLKLTLGV